MGMLDNIQTGRENKPPRIMIYGSEGVGKSSYAAGAPNAIFIQTEDGLGEIDCRKFPLAHSLSEVIAELTALRDEAHEFQSVVVDSVDWLERLIFEGLPRIRCPFHRKSRRRLRQGIYPCADSLAQGHQPASGIARQARNDGHSGRPCEGRTVRRSGKRRLRSLHTASPQARCKPDRGMGRRRSVREQEVPGDKGGTRDRRSHRRGWRGTHHPHGGKPRLHREEPLRPAVGNSALVAGIH